LFSNLAPAQIKVDASGHVGLFSSTIPVNTDVLLNGRIQLYTSASITFKNYYGNYLNIAATSNTIPIIYPGSNNNGTVGLSNCGFTNMYSYGFTNLSDKRQKENIRDIEDALGIVLKMKGVKYDLKKEFAYNESLIKDANLISKLENGRKNKIGFLAQDVQKVLPEVVVYDDSTDIYGIEYSKIVPVLVEAIKELSSEIENLKNTPKEKSTTIGEGNGEPATLNQNIPNPFSENTTINMYLPNTVSRATLYIYNMQGEQIKYIAINEKGNTSITIEGHSLKAGMYLYTLIADGKEVDTKKMILTK
jgi:hypothetical protein